MQNNSFKPQKQWEQTSTGYYIERMKTGTYRRVCNHCKWLYYVKPSRDRRILRDLEARHHHNEK